MYDLRKLGYLAIHLVLLAGNGYSQDPTQPVSVAATRLNTDSQLQAPRRDGQAISLLAQCSAHAHEIADFVATGSLTEGDKQGTVTVTGKNWDQTRIVISGIANDTQTFITGRGKAKNQSYLGQQKAPIPAHILAYRRPEYVQDGLCAVDLARTKMNIVLIGTESVNGQMTYHIRNYVSPDQDNPREELLSDFHLYLDVTTLLPVKTQTRIFSPDAVENSSLFETYYNDYRTVGNTKIAFHIENYLAGHKVRTVQFDSVALNTGVTDSAITDF